MTGAFSAVGFVATVLAGGSVLAVGCAEDASVPPPSSTLPDGSTTQGRTTETTPSSPDGGQVAVLVVDAGREASPDAGREAGADAGDRACTVNEDCLEGKCFAGICICQADSFVQPDGTCGPTPPAADCLNQGGHCKNGSTCPAGETAGLPENNRYCGDLIAAVCCFDCRRGPENLVCCPTFADDSGPKPPVCTNGWKTCPRETTPILGRLDDRDLCRR